jgi:hypothetical protein
MSDEWRVTGNKLTSPERKRSFTFSSLVTYHSSL